MIELPRLGLAVSGSGQEPSVAGLALLAGLRLRKYSIQHFRSKACPTSTAVVRQVTGLPGRHLDAWLMPPEVCRAVFIRGSQHGTLSVVEGTFDPSGPMLGLTHFQRPGDIQPIAEALDLPIIAVVSCSHGCEFHLPKLPPRFDAILLDGVRDHDDFERHRHMLQVLTRKPVIGAVGELPEIRELLKNFAPQDNLPEEIVQALAKSFHQFADFSALIELAESRLITPMCCKAACSRPKVRVAYALDEVFGGYFPDTLETLEALGADLVDFSPLRDEALPPEADLVLIGCGFADTYADALAANQCLIASLKAHACQGRRVYSEGGGTAYLGRAMIIDGRMIPGVGLLPIVSELRKNPTPPQPVERTLSHNGWMGLEGTVVRGYRSGRWDLYPAELDNPCRNCYGTLAAEGDLVFHHHAVGSMIHLHLGALPEVVGAFLGVHRPSLTLPQTRHD